MLRSSLGPVVVVALAPESDPATPPAASAVPINYHLNSRLLKNIAARLEKSDKRGMWYNNRDLQ